MLKYACNLNRYKFSKMSFRPWSPLALPKAGKLVRNDRFWRFLFYFSIVSNFKFEFINNNTKSVLSFNLILAIISPCNIDFSKLLLFTAWINDTWYLQNGNVQKIFKGYKVLKIIRNKGFIVIHKQSAHRERQDFKQWKWYIKVVHK